MYAGGRPLWQLSLSLQPERQPLPVLRWSAAQKQEVEAARDEIMRGVGTPDPFHEEIAKPVFARYAVSVSYRRPLRVDEVNLIKDTPMVRKRPGRP